jgi:ferrous iron transport protein A
MKNRPHTSLDRIAPGDLATVVHVSGDDPIARRLSDLGFWPGTLVRTIRRAPLGDPAQYFLRGYRLALRKDEAARIIVEAVAKESEAESRMAAPPGRAAGLGGMLRAFLGLSRPEPRRVGGLR